MKRENEEDMRLRWKGRKKTEIEKKEYRKWR